MATFVEDQIRSLAEIFEVTSDYMSQYLSVRSGIITDSDKTSILARVTAFQLVETDNMEIAAGPAGFKGSISADKKRSLIKSKIAALIGWDTGTGPELVRR